MVMSTVVKATISALMRQNKEDALVWRISELTRAYSVLRLNHEYLLNYAEHIRTLLARSWADSFR